MRTSPVRRRDVERGIAMVALLVLMSVMAIAMGTALPAWHTMARREREAELVFRGEQYARAIMLFQRKYAGTYPPNIDVLVNERFLRKKYKDPITNDDFQPVGVGQAITLQTPAGVTGGAPGGGRGGAPGAATAPQGRGRSGPTTTALVGGGRSATFGVTGATPGIMGVTSKSKDESIRLYLGRNHYNEWIFVATQAQVQAGGRGAQAPGQGVRGGQPPGGRGGQPIGGRGGPGQNPRGGGPASAPFGFPAGRGRF